VRAPHDRRGSITHPAADWRPGRREVIVTSPHTVLLAPVRSQCTVGSRTLVLISADVGRRVFCRRPCLLTWGIFKYLLIPLHYKLHR
jgi:hypothetical protein